MFIPLLPLAWLEGLGPLLLVFVWVIRQVFSAIQEQKAQEAAKQARPQAPQGLPPKQVVRQPDGQRGGQDWGDAEPVEARGGQAPQGDLRSEVDEFLKRIAQASDEAAGKQQGRAEPPPEAVKRRRALDPFEEPPRRVARKPKPTPEPEIELLVDEPTPQRASRQSPAKSKKKQELRHLPESQLAEKAAHLGEKISRSDDRVEARLHEKFDHQLGRLRQDESKAESAGDQQTGAQRVKALLTRPGGVRDAIILGEILRRPHQD